MVLSVLMIDVHTTEPLQLYYQLNLNPFGMLELRLRWVMSATKQVRISIGSKVTKGPLMRRSSRYRAPCCIMASAASERSRRKRSGRCDFFSLSVPLRKYPTSFQRCRGRLGVAIFGFTSADGLHLIPQRSPFVLALRLAS